MGTAPGCDIGAADGSNIALVHHQADDRTPTETIANARLIAKAPEMHAALVRISKGEGAFNLDPLKHAGNVIEEHKDIARALLRELDA